MSTISFIFKLPKVHKHLLKQRVFCALLKATHTNTHTCMTMMTQQCSQFVWKIVWQCHLFSFFLSTKHLDRDSWNKSKIINQVYTLSFTSLIYSKLNYHYCDHIQVIHACLQIFTKEQTTTTKQRKFVNLSRKDTGLID